MFKWLPVMLLAATSVGFVSCGDDDEEMVPAESGVSAPSAETQSGNGENGGGAVTPSSGNTFTVNGVSFTMMPVEGGTFQMGATSEQGSDAYDNEKPVHNVTLSSYSIG